MHWFIIRKPCKHFLCFHQRDDSTFIIKRSIKIVQNGNTCWKRDDLLKFRCHVFWKMHNSLEHCFRTSLSCHTLFQTNQLLISSYFKSFKTYLRFSQESEKLGTWKAIRLKFYYPLFARCHKSFYWDVL